MKTLLISSIFLTMFYSCKPVAKQQKAERLVNKYMDSLFKNSDSYQSIGFSKLDSVFTSYESDPNYYNYKYQADDYKLSDKTRATSRRKADSLKLHFNPSFKGFMVAHSFMAKNEFGALMMHDVLVKMDSSITKVYSIRE